MTRLGLSVLFAISFWVQPVVFSQSLTGTAGLIKIPTGEMYPDKTFSLGATYIPKGYYKRTYGELKGKITENAGSATFVTLNLLPSIEVMFRYTHEFGLKVNPTTQYFPDRMFTVRWQLFKEKKAFLLLS